ncbi:MAG: YIP1 family protein [Sandaracinaceae bacterium]
MNEASEPELVGAWLGALVRPRATFQELASAPSGRAGLGAVTLTGMSWGAFTLILWAAGREARFTLLPIDGHDYYLLQGVLMLPLLSGLYWVFATVAHRLALRWGGHGSEAGTRAALGFAYGVPLALHVAAELFAYLFVGPDAMSWVARVSMPLASIYALALSTLALIVVHGLPRGRAAAAALLGLLAQLALGALVLR